MRPFTTRLLALFCLVIPGLVTAHHGRDFLLVQDYYIPGLDDGVLITNFEYSRTGTDYEFGIEPEILVGILPRVALGVSVGFTDQTGMSWAYESVMPSIHIQLTPPDSDFPIRFAISAGYEFAREHAGHAHGTSSPSVTSTSSNKGISSTASRSTSHGSGRGSASAPGARTGGGGILGAMAPLFERTPSPTVASAPAPQAEAALAAAPADYGTGASLAPTPSPTSTTTPATCPDLGPDAPPCPTPGGTGGGGTGGAGDGHNHSHNGAGHSHGSGAQHSHSNSGAHDHGDDRHSHDDGDHDHDDEAGGHDHGDGGKGHHGHGSTIHIHGEDAFIGRFIMETDLGEKNKLVVNLINVLPDDGTAAWGYAAGLRHNLTHAFSVSLEAMGDFSEDGYHEVNLGAFAVPNHHVTLRLGAGMGLTPASPDWSVRGGVIWRF